jgi:CheY-like chemotaxis protein
MTNKMNKCCKKAFPLVVVDLNMPVMAGNEMMKVLLSSWKGEEGDL